MHLFFIFLIVTFKIKSAVAPEYRDLWVIWNVGQGQWVTHILTDECRHYDIGGEFGSFKHVKRQLLIECGTHLNRIYLSHWDTDHFLNLPLLARALPKVCWQDRPQVFENKKSAQKILQLNIPFCEPIAAEQSLHPLSWISSNITETNKSSHITIDNGVLNTGDSPISVERLWCTEMPGLQNIQVLMLGHHGSRTSTGSELLGHLTGLNWAAASARMAKYGHPHAETILRLAQKSIPVIRTEIWGNIWFQTGRLADF